MNVSRIIEVTMTLVLVYLVVTHGSQFAQVVSSIASGYTSSVKALQGR
jgi:hypothetical protein